MCRNWRASNTHFQDDSLPDKLLCSLLFCHVLALLHVIFFSSFSVPVSLQVWKGLGVFFFFFFLFNWFVSFCSAGLHCFCVGFFFLVVVSRGYSLLWCSGFSLWWLLLCASLDIRVWCTTIGQKTSPQSLPACRVNSWMQLEALSYND